MYHHKSLFSIHYYEEILPDLIGPDISGMVNVSENCNDFETVIT